MEACLEFTWVFGGGMVIVSFLGCIVGTLIFKYVRERR